MRHFSPALIEIQLSQHIKELMMLLCTLGFLANESTIAADGLLPTTSYASTNDSPFISEISTGGVLLENFEDSSIDTPGLFISPYRFCNSNVCDAVGAVDSVDGDDGVIDGAGTAGVSLASPHAAEATGLTFTFDPLRFSILPRKVGIVWTDGSNGGTAIFEVFDIDGNLLGSNVVNGIGDASFFGTTSEDRFFGAEFQNGIGSFKISHSGGSTMEVDHLQYEVSALLPPSANNVIPVTPYSGVADSPFIEAINNGSVVVDDFENSRINAQGVTVSTFRFCDLNFCDQAGAVDSVDEDDGSIDGVGTGGVSLASNIGQEADGLTFTFDPAQFTVLPRKVGIVWTDGSPGGSVLLEIFDGSGNLLSGSNTANIGDSSFFGSTGEDRFFGAEFDQGIGSFRISHTGTKTMEVDHLQFEMTNYISPPLEVENIQINDGCLQIDFTNPTGIDAKLMGSIDLDTFDLDLTPYATITQTVSGSFTAKLNLASLPPEKLSIQIVRE